MARLESAARLEMHDRSSALPPRRQQGSGPQCYACLCRAFATLGCGLHEVRTNLVGNRMARVLFYIDKKSRMVLLHGFIEKTQKTPDEDLELARRYKSKHGSQGLQGQLGVARNSRNKRLRQTLRRWLGRIRLLWPECPAGPSQDGKYLIVRASTQAPAIRRIPA